MIPIAIGTPPRRRGGHDPLTNIGAPRRNTPASAGRTRGERVVGHWAQGTPPRRRGGQPTPAGALDVSRNTPALAGRTPHARGRRACGSEHPRVGGEDHRVDIAGRGVRGTPPRRRGGLPQRQPLGRAPRNTPASAGRTRSPPVGGRGRLEHPRVGGEDGPTRARAREPGGTPPRRRGGRLGGDVDDAAGRNTPASAGRTCMTSPKVRYEPEHPRVGGEDTWSGGTCHGYGGTPPRRRGGHRVGGGGGHVHRNTPASAGRTTSTASPPTPPPEHPRVGGEDRNSGPLWQSLGGTPPRRRGGRRQPVLGRLQQRNTPASAGRTPPRGHSRRRSPEHPRVGGEDIAPTGDITLNDGTPPRRRGGLVRVFADDLADRNTPASAGRTARGSPGRSSTSEHPRVGGEDLVEAGNYARDCGTPPRRRGGRRLVRHGPDPRRNTPASAGRTPKPPAKPKPKPEHPRVGGEDRSSHRISPHRSGTPSRRRGGHMLAKVAEAPAGAPPRRQGRPRCLARRPRRGRNTPTSAGRTHGRPRPVTCAAEHPRVGGEDANTRSAHFVEAGPLSVGAHDIDYLFVDEIHNGPPPHRRRRRRPVPRGNPASRSTFASAKRGSVTGTILSDRGHRVGKDDV